MRAICCAILAGVFYGMGALLANAGSYDKRAFVAGIHILLSYISAAIAIGLCIAGL